MAKPKKKSAKYSRENLSVFFKNALWAYKQIFQLAKVESIILFALTILQAFVPILTTYLSARLLDEIINAIDKQETFESLLNLDLSNTFLITIGLIFLTSLIGGMIRNKRRELEAKFKIIHFERYSNQFYKKVSSIDIQLLESKEFANVLNKAKDQLWKIRTFFNDSLMVSTSISAVIIQGIIIFNVSPLLFAVLSLSALPSMIFYGMFVSLWWDNHNSNQENYRKRWTNIHMLSNIEPLPELKVSGGISYFYKRMTDLTKKYSTEHWDLRKWGYRRDQFTNLISSLREIFTPLLLISKALTREISIGDFSFYFSTSMGYTQKLTNITTNFISLYDTSLAVKDVREVFDVEHIVKTGRKKLNNKQIPTIELKNVSFKYPDTKKYVLKGINLKIEPKDEIALVGENGAGKTTLIKLLVRFYEPTSGQILLNGTPIEEIDLEDYYNQIGILFQDFNSYNSHTFQQNITLGKNKGDYKEAAKQAEILNDIMDEDKKFKTVLGRKFTDGVAFSKGQKQKLAIARMFYQNSPILILDEPTASIDAVAEHRIFKRIFDFMEDKTVIIISHRFSTVRNAQKIYVLDKGKIIEQGSHKELLEMNGKYKKAFDVQAEGYN